jgi:VanZ family protein
MPVDPRPRLAGNVCLARWARLWVPVAGYMAVIFYFSSLNDPLLPAGTTDKTWHAAGYAGLAVLVCRALAGGFRHRLTLRMAAAAIAIATAYGVTDEFHQTFVPGRGWDANDLAADAIGACAGTIAAWAWGIISNPRDGV